MITIFDKFKTFWENFIEALKQAYNKAFKKPVESNVQEWRDITKINFLDIFVSKLNNLTNTEVTFEVESDSVQAKGLKKLCEELENNRFNITAAMLADGDYYCFPATNEKGDIIHSYLTQQQVRILNMDGDNITEAYAIIDWYINKSNRVYYLLRHHKLSNDGTLEISYAVVNDDGKPTRLEKWEYLNEQAYSFSNANHIGFGRYKSPASSRGLSSVYGVPLNFGCGEIEEKIFNDLKLIDDEFKNAKSKIFADPLILRKRKKQKDKEDEEYIIPENIFPVQHREGTKSNIDIFNPDIRYNEHYSKLLDDLALYERAVGTSKGILTENETTNSATATEVKRANSDTIALLDKIRNAIDAGNEMTLQADSVFLNVSPELWNYISDWYDPFEDPDAQWKRLLEAKNNGAAEDEDLIKWLFPKLSDEEIREKIERIKNSEKIDTDNALDRIFSGR